MITKFRTEQCCASLISCLLQTCKAEMNNDDESDSSSIEVYRALTSQLHEGDDQKKQKRQPPPQVVVKPIEKPPTITPSVNDDPAIDFFDNMANEALGQNSETLLREDSEESELLDDLIRNEDIFVAQIIVKCLKLCPSAFECEITKAEVMNLINKASRFLWTNVGTSLEHYVLWWSHIPLACRPVGCAKYLRDWLLIIQADDAPEPILSTLKGLGEILTVHAVGTTWDKHFRLCLVAGSLKIDHCYENTEFQHADELVSLFIKIFCNVYFILKLYFSYKGQLQADYGVIFSNH